MIVVCINNDNIEDILTISKTYNTITEDIFCYWIRNDSGYKHWYSISRFKILSEIRNEKIDKLLENES